MPCSSVFEPAPLKTPAAAWSLNTASVLPSLLWSALFMLVAGVACRVRDISREQQHNNLRWGELPSGDAYFSLLTTWRAQIACLNWTKSKQEQTHPVSAGSNCGEHGSGRWPTNTVVYRTLSGRLCSRQSVWKMLWEKEGTYPCSWLFA